MTYQVRRRQVYSLCDSNRCYELAFEPINAAWEVHEMPERRRAVVGYLHPAPYAENPLDCDTLGRILRRTRNAGHEERQECEDLLRKNDRCTVALSCYSHSGEVWAITDSLAYHQWPDHAWDVLRNAGVWVPDECCRDDIAYTALRKQLPDDVEIRWSSDKGRSFVELLVPGHKPRRCRSFAKAAQKAVKMLGIAVNKEQLFKDQRARAVEIAEAALTVYNAWLCGEVYLVVIEWHELKEDGQTQRLEEETCGDYYGYREAEKALADRLAEVLNDELETTHA